MHVRIRYFNDDAQSEDVIIPISKAAKIQELRKLIAAKLNIEPQQQRLLYRGKELIDDHIITEYGIQIDHIIHLVIRQKPIDDDKNSPKPVKEEIKQNEEHFECISKYYKIGDYIDVQLPETGAWYEAEIMKICRPGTNCEEGKDEDLIFKIKAAPNVQAFVEIDVTFNSIRPRSYYTYKRSELQKDMVVLVNYNIEVPKALGLWYDFVIDEVPRACDIKGTILMGREKAPIQNCLLNTKNNDILRIERAIFLHEKTQDSKDITYEPRKYPVNCDKCRDVEDKKCRECGCRICAGKNDWGSIILCDECDYGYHLSCLNPPLESVPDGDDWYCPSCKNDDSEIVKPGEMLKESKKKAKMPSISKPVSRDWGRGMACAGRTKECTIVPKNHFGPIPGIDVGTTWRYRFQAAEAGVHRPQVAGIHGKAEEGAYSICLSGGYEDDVDNGKEFLYTGAGGRDLSGNKRVNDQSLDQTLTRTNLALARNCYAPLNKEGAESTDWKKGKPVRVLRNYNGQAHSKYAPKIGNRYDGIYKVVKYYKEKGKSGFIVWRYLLRRDDPTPAPWQEGGQEFECIYPPNYEEVEAAKQKVKEEQAKAKKSKNTPKKVAQGTKRKSTMLDIFLQSPPKKSKVVEYQIPAEVENLISTDEKNHKLWNECKGCVKDGKKGFLDKVQEIFLCVCCQEVVFKPVTTECGHNICKSCFKRSFSCEIYNCPYCRHDLGKDYSLIVNDVLSEALKLLFPGYEAGR